MSAAVDVVLFERTDPRLGRHQVHDDRSRGFAMQAGPVPTGLVLHERHVQIFDQGELGSCTANAALGVLASGPLWRHTDPEWTEQDAVSLYELETRLDDREIPGHYPPDDTGSAGIYSAKALRRRGLITGYTHAFTLTAALSMLGRQPVSIGVPWFQSMFTPDSDGLVPVDPASGVAGGHQVCLDGVDGQRRLVRLANSWGTGWGDSGHGWLSWEDLGLLLGQGGDVVTFTRP